MFRLAMSQFSYVNALQGFDMACFGKWTMRVTDWRLREVNRSYCLNECSVCEKGWQRCDDKWLAGLRDWLVCERDKRLCEVDWRLCEKDWLLTRIWKWGSCVINEGVFDRWNGYFGWWVGGLCCEVIYLVCWGLSFCFGMDGARTKGFMLPLIARIYTNWEPKLNLT